MLRRSGHTEPARLTEIYELRRKGRYTLNVPDIGLVELRDQRPLHPAGLERALAGSMLPQDWVNLLNDRVFLWTSCKLAQTLQQAAAARDLPACLIELRTPALLEAYGSAIELTTFNVGYTLRKPRPRNRESFIPLASYPASQSRKVREVTVKTDLADLSRFLV